MKIEKAEVDYHLQNIKEHFESKHGGWPLTFSCYSCYYASDELLIKILDKAGFKVKANRHGRMIHKKRDKK